MILITSSLPPQISPSAAFCLHHTDKTQAWENPAGCHFQDTVQAGKANQALSDPLHILHPQPQMSPQLCQTNLPHHLLSLCIVIFYKVYLHFPSFCPCYTMTFFFLIRQSCLLLYRENRCYQIGNPHNQTHRHACKGTHPILLHSDNRRGVDTTIPPFGLCILLQPTTFWIFYYYLSFSISYSQPLSDWSFSVLKHLPTISTRVLLPISLLPLLSNLKEGLSSLIVAISPLPTHPTTHSDLDLMHHSTEIALANIPLKSTQPCSVDTF